MRETTKKKNLFMNYPQAFICSLIGSTLHRRDYEEVRELSITIITD